MERPTNLIARAQAWTRYNHTNTIKYLIGIASVGTVRFLSRGWSGRFLTKKILTDQNFMTLYKMVIW